MYRVTWKHFVLELICALLAVYLVCGGVAFGWFLLDLRGGTMLLWGLLVALPVALAPYFLAAHYRSQLWQESPKPQHACDSCGTLYFQQQDCDWCPSTQAKPAAHAKRPIGFVWNSPARRRRQHDERYALDA